ncbi:hypothetical protein SR39_31640 [Methylobacterium radiotolerans]|jgi:uncharacterized membrane protein YagU involved in acid resistance|uniref:hypothetical protein n=1 Tax=Methylobacterium aquaticum TaxID=270351 RepID=UPI0005BE3233|nr:hypothetical protein [Methylobacterium aquaticum]KIU26363.1 hypothetical protein SR39_31640 [Methylobacterium radiotolerans]
MGSQKDNLLVDVAIGLAAGFVATKVTEFAQEALYRPMPESVKQAEEAVRPGPPPEVAARKTMQAIGHPLGQQKLKFATMAVHYGLGVGWGPLYGLLRRQSRMQPLGAGFVTGAAMSLIVDEALTPALGFSAPSRAYPNITHVRGLVAHLVYGAAAALAAESLYRLLNVSPDSEAGRTELPSRGPNGA